MSNVQRVKNAFFRQKTIDDMISKKRYRALSKMGAFVRRSAKTSLRYRKKPSPPGAPPSVHRSNMFKRRKTDKQGNSKDVMQSPLRELLFFAYDQQAKSVVVGPVPLGAKAIVPGVLERGGSVVSRTQGRPRRVTIAPRPYMKPAVNRERHKFKALFKGW